MKQIRSFFLVFLLWTLVGMFSKFAFLFSYYSLLDGPNAVSQLEVVFHGLRLDIAVAGYLTLIPGLLLIATLWLSNSRLRWFWRCYFAVTALLATLAYIANLGLYGYWGFPLDNTPLLYVKTSPADAMASLQWWQLLLFPLLIVLVSGVIYMLGCRLLPIITDRNAKKSGIRIIKSVMLLVLDLLLLLPIRGGLGTGTNHTGSVYFSSNIRLNHAAVNPVFSFIEAVLHQEEIGTKYRFMSEEEAMALFKPMTFTPLRTDSVTIQHPNVVLVVLESFSDSVMQAKGVTPNLLRYTSEGLNFSNFYANSFRTDRALVSIHSGLPAQPSMSVMDIPRISTSLPSLAGTLAKNGYQTIFYYGGDINYSNMRSYFMGTGFQRVVSDVDFPTKLHTGKWGVADGPVYDRMLADIKADNSGKPFFYSVMTASSHEPFDVPDYLKIKDDETLNAFSYADHCLGKFVEELKTLPCWQNTLVAIVSDHLGAYPDPQDNYQLWRYQIPFVIMGAQMPAKQCTVLGSQMDIPATLLGLLGYDHSEFCYSKDLLDVRVPRFAFFSFPDAMGMVTDSSAVVYDNTSEQIQLSIGKDADGLLRKAKAYLQKLYDDLDSR